jgi:L-cysteine/cystine lyase
LCTGEKVGQQALSDAAQGPATRLEGALQPRTRLVVLSHLLWNTGQLMPIARVAQQLHRHANQPWLLVDAAHCLRACTHITTTAGEGDQLASALAELIRQP